MKEFNKKEYDLQFRKDNYARFLVDLPKDEKEKFDKLLKEEQLSKADFLRDAIERYKDSMNPITCRVYADYIEFSRFDEEYNEDTFISGFKIKDDEFVHIEILDVIDTILNINKHNIVLVNKRNEKYNK